MPSSSQPTPSREATEASAPDYRRVSLAAVGALALGVLSPLAFAGPTLWFVPAAGLLAAASALRATRQGDAMLTGRSIAHVGLLLSVCFGVAAPVSTLGAGWLLRRSAAPFAKTFFQELAEGRPQNALQLQNTAAHRRAPDDTLWDFHRRDEAAQRELKKFVAEPVVKTLLLLGRRAEARLYDSDAPVRFDHRESLSQIYAVTFDLDGRKTTFFVKLRLERNAAAGQAPAWRVASLDGPERPAPWGE
jgi:hypothetical protein